MAIRVQTRADVNFGNAGAAARATHVRAREADDSNPLVKELPNPIEFAVGAPMRIPAGLYDVVYPAGELTNDHMMDVIAPWWGDADKNGIGNKAMEMDLMTDANTPFAIAGYAQQAVNDWGLSAEAD